MQRLNDRAIAHNLPNTRSGFLHGAYFEGLDVANEMIQCINEGGCVGLEHIEEVKNARPYQI